jgi:hypothetical protein
MDLDIRSPGTWIVFAALAAPLRATSQWRL